ncbi:B12-binding domain-containing radical SAM protein [Cereibacter azotoformans]|uniref:Radical SAM superfamily enzyme YgiQ (UPF0313 family) n=1 Tax=Cereibacter azotoformans TaxID=43057 RepID=A0A2T5JKV1_9RHOB|nr:radical SAM protein [Cereibacter azotoformans]AXQ95759.1 radical SAM protein [Cereibacter sphaeroides]PTR07307.1 radical SAM superfamily enzyme YgiQ (UPF0313 family) [Cereibacter azotoformans]UIJ32739.1 B12-binding domain-containing radical SAM protein [Cereibacter azotoformans]
MAADGTRTADEQLGRVLRICIINPRFNPSIWSNDYAIALYGGPAKCNMVTGCLATLAALVDPRHHVRIIDENVEDIDFEELRGYDVIGVTGMIVQRWHMYRILDALRGIGGRVVVGGPLVTCDEAAFEGKCDVAFIGEAEMTWPAYLEDLAAGRPTLTRYAQSARSDMTRIPKPRLDLIKSERYRVASIQFSRGCPYLCEFCDIIVMFGRVPRLKTVEQVIAELQDVHDAGFRQCFLVDDNFIGNKREAKRLLQAIAAWQKTLPRPLNLSTEASVNLADEPDLLDLMRQANFDRVFVGIETPNLASLKETRKTQNLRGDSLVAKVQRIRNAGLIVTGGFIVGFDEDTPEIFEAQYKFIHDSGIVMSSIGILAPLPTTPLYERLEAEGRLFPDDPECAFIPKQMTREQLKAGHRALIERVFAPDAFFERAFRSLHESQNYNTVRRQRYRPAAGARAALGQAATWLRLLRAIASKGYLSLVAAYHRAWRANRDLGDRAMPAAEFLSLCLAHWHIYCISRGPQDSVYLEQKRPRS